MRGLPWPYHRVSFTASTGAPIPWSMRSMPMRPCSCPCHRFRWSAAPGSIRSSTSLHRCSPSMWCRAMLPWPRCRRPAAQAASRSPSKASTKRTSSGKPLHRASATRASRPVCSWPTAWARSTRSSFPSSSSRPRRLPTRSMPPLTSPTCCRKWPVRVSWTSSPATTTPSSCSCCAPARPPGAPATCSRTPPAWALCPVPCPAAWCCLPAHRACRPCSRWATTPRLRWPKTLTSPPSATSL